LSGIDGRNYGFNIGVLGQKNAYCVWLRLHALRQKLNAGHPGHTLIGDDQRHFILA
jgi:hypothetical protein